MNNKKYKYQKCGICGSEAIVRNGKFGDFFCCPNFPKCQRETLSVKNYEKYIKESGAIIKTKTEFAGIKESVDNFCRKITPVYDKYVYETFLDYIEDDYSDFIDNDY